MAGSSEISLVDPASMSDTVSTILDDCLYNIISDTVLKAHREEKQARMQSAAILAQQTKDSARAEASPGGEAEIITTAGATIDSNDRIFLHSNPLRTTPEILCPTCRLPRLQYPTMGRNSQASDPAKEYCAKQPYINKDGCDIYGKSLALEKPSKKKSMNAMNSKPASKQDSRSGSESPGGNSPNGKADSAKPAATSVPSGKCPYCPRYMAFTRIAQHMDRCLKVQARQSSKNAMSKLQSSTPRDLSRASTPRPGAKPDTGAAAASSQGSNVANNANVNANGKKRKLERGSDDEAEPDTPVKKKKLLKKEKSMTGLSTGMSGASSDVKDKKDKEKDAGADAKEKRQKEEGETKDGKKERDKPPSSSLPRAKGAEKRLPGAASAAGVPGEG